METTIIEISKNEKANSLEYKINCNDKKTLQELKHSIDCFFDNSKNQLSKNESFKSSSIKQDYQNFTITDSIFIKRFNKLIRVKLSDIICLEAARNYCDIIMSNKQKIDVSAPLNSVFEDLNNNSFIRINRSTVVNINYIKEITGNMVKLSNNESFPISEKYRKHFFSIFNVIGSRKRTKKNLTIKKSENKVAENMKLSVPDIN